MKRCGPRREVTLRIPVELHARVRRLATGWHNSMNDQLVHLIRRGLEVEANLVESGQEGMRASR